MGLIYFISFFTLIAAIMLIWAIVQLQHNSEQPMETT